MRWTFFLVSATALACSREPRSLSMTAPESYFQRNGYVEMVQALELPARDLRRDRTEVWLKLPANGHITTRFLSEQKRHVIRLPTGSDAVRVEYRAYGSDPKNLVWSVADVRGTRFEDQNEVFYALRPRTSAALSPLEGFSWPRGNERARIRASEKLAALVAGLASPETRQRSVERARANNHCEKCHAYARAPNVRLKEHGIVNRGTDDSGLFQIQAVLERRLPLETYFPEDPNLDNPLVRVFCGDTPLADKHAGCSNQVPTAELDVKRARDQKDARVDKLCASRRYLFAALDPAGRQGFAAGFEECGIAP